MGPIIYMFLSSFSRFLHHPFNCFASFLLCLDMHMYMTQQEAIKISNNLMAEMFFTCLWTRDEGRGKRERNAWGRIMMMTLPCFVDAWTQTTSVLVFSCTFLTFCVLSYPKSFPFWDWRYCPRGWKQRQNIEVMKHEPQKTLFLSDFYVAIVTESSLSNLQYPPTSPLGSHHFRNDWKIPVKLFDKRLSTIRMRSKNGRKICALNASQSLITRGRSSWKKDTSRNINIV